MAEKSKEKPLIKDSQGKENINSNVLLLFNDDVNSFDYVIESLIEVCNHTGIQAEQCAMIAHYNGKSEVKTGDFKTLEHMQADLGNRGLTSIIE